MTTLSRTQLRVMQSDYLASLPDVCVYITRTFSQDASYGTVRSESVSPAIRCGFEFSPYKFRAREIGGIGEEQSEILSRVRVTKTDFNALEMAETGVIRLTHRFGEQLNLYEDYEIQGFAEYGSAGVILNVKRVDL